MSCEICGRSVVLLHRDDGLDICNLCFLDGKEIMCQKCKKKPGVNRAETIFEKAVFCDTCYIEENQNKEIDNKRRDKLCLQ